MKNQNLDKHISRNLWNICLMWRVTNRCNFDCFYCINKLIPLKKPDKISKINISCFLKTLKKTKKIFLINFAGGEPLLVPNFIDACKKITEKHFITINSNLFSKQIKDFSEEINPERVAFINASFHLEELKKRNLIKNFISNFSLLQKKGFKIRASVVAHPLILPKIREYKDFFRRNNINFTFILFCGEYKGKYYPRAYTLRELSNLGFNKKELKKYERFGKLCNTGYNLLVVSEEGEIYPHCSPMKRSLGNIYKKINFKKDLTICPYPFCSCPPEIIDPHTFELSLNAILKLQFLLDKNIGKIGLFLKNHSPNLYYKLRKIKNEI